MKKFMKACVLSAVLAGGFAAPAVAQTKRQELVIVYYTDDSYQTIAGQRVVYCDGSSTRVGELTPYDQEIYYGC